MKESVLEGTLYGWAFGRDYSSTIDVWVKTDERVFVQKNASGEDKLGRERVQVSNRYGSIGFRYIIGRVGKFTLFPNLRRGLEVRHIVKHVSYNFENNHEGYDSLINALDKIRWGTRIRIKYPGGSNGLEVEVVKS